MNENAPTLIPTNPARRIDEFGQELAAALLDEYQKKAKIAEAEANVQSVEAGLIATATVNGQIDGGNKDTREAQRAGIIASSMSCQAACNGLTEVKEEAELAEIERRRVEAVISLTRAWLYSQSGGKTVNIEA